MEQVVAISVSEEQQAMLANWFAIEPDFGQDPDTVSATIMRAVWDALPAGES